MDLIEEKLKAALNVDVVKSTSIISVGCINKGRAFKTDKGMVYVKMNRNKEKARIMFQGEFESLKAIAGTNTIKVPKPLAVLNDEETGDTALVTEFLELSTLGSHEQKLGTLLAKLHLFNEERLNIYSSENKKHNDKEMTQCVDKFGLYTTTCCGHIPLDNTLNSNWVEFFAQQRLQKQLDLIETEYGDREAMQLWSRLQLRLPVFFEEVTVYPALLHGDLWRGNAGSVDGEPVVFDPASFYGHSEFDLAIAAIFGGFSAAFYSAYHSVIPKQKGFERRHDLYQLFHYLNHWNHFGKGYRGKSIYLMKKLLKE